MQSERDGCVGWIVETFNPKDPLSLSNFTLTSGLLNYPPLYQPLKVPPFSRFI